MITLHYAPDNASLIVRILLEELDLTYQTVLVDRSCKEQRSEQYLRLNPNGLIPVCIINDKPVFETAAILLTLADKHNRFSVAPDDERRAEFLQCLVYISNSLHVDCRMRFYPEIYAADSAVFRDNTIKSLHERLRILNDAYQLTNSDYLFGGDPVIIDIYLAVCLRWIQLYPAREKGSIELSRYSALLSMSDKLQQRSKVIAACAMEGITGRLFTAPDFCAPPEGVAL